MFFKVLCFGLSLLIINASGSPVRSCEDGESYWCRSLKTARLCKQVEHCLQHVWPNQDVKTGCVSGTRAAQQLQKQAEATACDVLTPKYKARCLEVVESSREDIEKMTNMEVHPRNIAKLLGLCSTTKEPAICTDCKAFTTDIKLFLAGSATEKYVQEYFKTVCGNFVALGTYTKMCEDITEDWVKHMFQTIKYETPFSAVCDALKFCDDGADKVKHKHMQMKAAKYFYGMYLEGASPKACMTCKSLVAQLKSVLSSPDLQKAVGEFISTEGCPMFPAQFVDTCTELLDDNINLLFQLVISVLDETFVCDMMGMCDESGEVDKPSLTTLLGTQLENAVTPWLKEQKAKLDTELVNVHKHVQSRVEEEITKHLSTMATYLENVYDEAKEIAGLFKQSILDAFSVSSFDELENKIEKTLLPLVKEQITKLDAELENVQKDIELIVKGANDVYDEAVDFAKEIAKSVEDEFSQHMKDSAIWLKEQITNLDEEIQNVESKIKSMIELELTKKLEDVATFVNNEYDAANDLAQLFKQYVFDQFSVTSFEELEDKIVQSLPWVEEQITLLNEQLVNVQNEIKSVVKDIIKEQLRNIETFVDEVHGDIIEVGQTLKTSLLDAFSVSTFEELEDLVSREWDNLQSEINEYFNQMEAEMKLKPPTYSLGQSKQEKLESSGECKMCTMLTKEMLGMLKNTKTQETILQSIKELCDNLPDPIGQQCRSLVRTEGTVLLKKIFGILSPQLVCEAIGFCGDYNTEKSTLLKVSSFIGRNVYKVATNLQGGDESGWCQICHVIAGIVQEDAVALVQAAPLSQVSQTVCQYLGGAVDMDRCITRFKVVGMLSFEAFKDIWSAKSACATLGVCARPHASTVLLFKPEH